MTPQGALTPKGPGTVTPGRTPLRDKLNINTEEQLADPAYARHMVTQTTIEMAVSNLFSVCITFILCVCNFYFVCMCVATRVKGAAEAGSDVAADPQERL